ncbi:MAG: M23 family metallopeptidase [Lachnospiraceae bacterium]|nr:M23 family metallopeptidase [Lachnospiraceae bacterium]
MYIRWKGLGFVVFIILVEVFVINGVEASLYRCLEKRKVQEIQDLQTVQSVVEEISCFPIPISHRHQVSYQNDFGASRGSGVHEGCDIMSNVNEAGVIPIVSATDGVITNLGWLYLGGYRVGITSKNGNYYYYAHFDSYSKRLKVGEEVQAGEFLGFMGCTGEGEEGTSGKFPVHLHFGIYVTDKDGTEKAVNPYHYLTKIND